MRREELVAEAAWASAKNGCPCRSRMAVVLWQGQGARLVTPHRCGGTCGAGVSIDHHHCRSQRALELTLETHRLGPYYVGMEVDLRGARSSVTPLRLVRVLWSGQLEAGALWRVRSGTTLEIHVARSQECTRKAERTAALLEKLTVLDEALSKALGVQAIANLADHNDLARIWDQSHKRLVGKLQQHARQMHPSRL